MRTVEFVPGTHRTTQRVVTAVLRALERRGTRTWRGGNVSRAVSGYVAEHLGESYEATRISYALKWLEDHGYGTRERSKSRTVGFTLHDDVATAVPSYVTSGWGEYGAADTPRSRSQRATSAGPRPSVVQPVLPFSNGDMPLYGLDRLVPALERWAARDHDGYTAWVDQVLAQLQEETRT